MIKSKNLFFEKKGVFSIPERRLKFIVTRKLKRNRGRNENEIKKE